PGRIRPRVIRRPRRTSGGTGTTTTGPKHRRTRSGWISSPTRKKPPASVKPRKKRAKRGAREIRSTAKGAKGATEEVDFYRGERRGENSHALGSSPSVMDVSRETGVPIQRGLCAEWGAKRLYNL